MNSYLEIDEMFKEQLAEFSNRKPTWISERDSLHLQVWRGKWRPIECDEFRTRSHFFKVASGERIVAAGRFEEWDCIGESDLDYFSYVADSVDQDAYDMGMAMFRSFCEPEEDSDLYLLDFGSVMVFDRVRIIAANAHESRAVWALIRTIFTRFRRFGRIAGIVLKAYPFARRNKGDEKFERGKKAMMRLYTDQLGMITLPGLPGEEGWQWLAVRCLLEPEPSSREPQWD